MKSNNCSVKLSLLSDEINHIAVFNDDKHFNTYLMEYLTTFEGRFEIVAGNTAFIMGDEDFVVSLSGCYIVYKYEDNLFAFVKLKEKNEIKAGYNRLKEIGYFI